VILSASIRNRTRSETKNNFDKNTFPHKFNIGIKVLISNDFYVGKNPKLAPNFTGPGEIIDINGTYAKVKINNKIKVLNADKLKLFLQNSDSEQKSNLQDLHFNDPTSEKPLTPAHAKLIYYKNSAQLALISLMKMVELMMVK